MAQEFRAVTRKKWIARKRMKYQSINDVEKNLSRDTGKFNSHFSILCEKMATSDYFINAMRTMEDALRSKSSLMPNKIVCLGLGSFTKDFHSLHQLAFIDRTKHYLKIEEAEFYDPVFQRIEKQILQEMKCSIMTENCEAKYLADVPTIFYLPHCANCLTNNLLWTNWTPKALKNIILISNSFDSLTTNKPHRLLRTDSSYILDIFKFTKEYPLEDSYETQNIFNDLSLHIFYEETMPSLSDCLWESKDAPTYNDVEMITAEDLSKLAIK